MKAHSSHGSFKVSAFQATQATARPLYAGVACRQSRLGQGTAAASASASSGTGKPALAELAEGPYFVLALLFDASTLCRTDAACRLLRQLNRASVGPWRALGARLFHGLELEREGTFEQPALGLDDTVGNHGAWEGSSCLVSCGGNTSNVSRKLKRIDWKARFRHFRADVPTFCAPFGGREIAAVAHPDEVAYFRCRLCTDVLDEASTQGAYLEVEVIVNPDNLSMAVVDFEAGGCSSVTFSPDTGAVIRERKVREAPRKVEGAYIQPLPTVPPGRRFHGRMGLYLRQGRLAFFRRCVGIGSSTASNASEHAATDVTTALEEPTTEGGYAGGSSSSTAMPQVAGPVAWSSTSPAAIQSADSGARLPPSPVGAAPGSAVHADAEMGPWETTGFVSDLGWAEGRRLTPCLAFRDEGAYQVRVVCVGSKPPVPQEQWPSEALRRDPGPHASAAGRASGDDPTGWSGFDWEVGPPALPEAVET